MVKLGFGLAHLSRTMDVAALRTRTFKFGDHTVLAQCRAGPDGEAASAQADEHVERAAEVTDTVGWDVWDSATIAMCERLVAEPALVRGKRVLELGAGVGVVGILAGLVGASDVILTDYDDGALAIADINIKLNGLESTCHVRKYDWGTEPAPRPDGAVPSNAGSGHASFDVVIGSDLLYSSSMADKLRAAVGALLSRSPACLMYLSHQVRHSVTWNKEREPVIEDHDSVLLRFLSACDSSSSAELTKPEEEDATQSSSDCIGYVQEHGDVDKGQTARSTRYIGAEGHVCMFTFRYCTK